MADIPLQFRSDELSLPGLQKVGFDVGYKNHALAILAKDFPRLLKELCASLMGMRITDMELVKSGGGEAPSTQRLRRSLTGKGWEKNTIVIQKIVDGSERSSTTHEIDHVRRTKNGVIALEIEWNNKDPFFDRDLENFQRLHSEGVISVGIIVTRGKSLQDNLSRIVADCAIRHEVRSFEDLFEVFGLRPTQRQRSRVKATGADFVEDWAKRFVQDKFGTATTHWEKLQDRMERGLGNPCPLVLIGIPSALISADADE